MADEYIADESGFNDTVWDGQSITLTAAAFAARAGVPVGGPVVTRSGVLPSYGDPLRYVSNGDMTGTLKAGAYWLASTAALHGGYLVVVPTDQVFTHTTAASSLRNDLIIVEVANTGVVSTSFKKVRIHKVTSGGGTPVMPTPIGVGTSIAIASVPIPANATAIGTPVDLRTFTAAAGGGVRFANRAAAEAAQLPEGTPVFLRDVQRAGLVGINGAVVLAGPPVVRQEDGTNGHANANLSPSSQLQSLPLTTFTLPNALKGSLLECEFSVVLDSPGAQINVADGAGTVTLDMAGRRRTLRWHSRGSTVRMYKFGTLSANVGADGNQPAVLSVTLDANTAIGVHIGEIEVYIRELH